MHDREDDFEISRPIRFATTTIAQIVRRQMQANPALARLLRSGEPVIHQGMSIAKVDPVVAGMEDKVRRAAPEDIWTWTSLLMDFQTLHNRPALFEIADGAVAELHAEDVESGFDILTSAINRPPGTLLHVQYRGTRPGLGPRGDGFNAFYARFGQSAIFGPIRGQGDGMESQLRNYLEIIFFRRPVTPNMLDEAAGSFVLHWPVGSTMDVRQALREFDEMAADATADVLAEMRGTSRKAARQAVVATMEHQRRPMRGEIALALRVLATPGAWTVIEDPRGIRGQSPAAEGEPAWRLLTDFIEA